MEMIAVNPPDYATEGRFLVGRLLAVRNGMDEKMLAFGGIIRLRGVHLYVPVFFHISSFAVPVKVPGAGLPGFGRLLRAGWSRELPTG